MSEIYSIPLSKLVEEFGFEKIFLPENYEDIIVRTPEVDRPGLALSGFFEIFNSERLQVIGKAEHTYLGGLDADTRAKHIKDFISAKPTAVLYTTGLPVFDEMLAEAQGAGVPIFRTSEKTSPVMAALIGSLNTHLAPRITRHGVLVEVYGEGLLLLGDSGVGKSETAIELIKRGHRLVADDCVIIKEIAWF
jgi:HPr kinase/phosphorylase